MNDFTKEELIDIHAAVMDTSIAMFEHLPVKIQAMIDNYCEHKERTVVKTEQSIIEYCKDCNPVSGVRRITSTFEPKEIK